MPFLAPEEHPQRQISYWKITEPESVLAEQVLPEEALKAQGIKHPARRLEYLASRLLLQKSVQKVGLRYRGIQKDKTGKPWLSDYPDVQLSLTHTAGFSALILQKGQPVGIDAEKPHIRLNKVVGRVFAEQELKWADSLAKKCVGWCAKEALYKWSGEQALFFRKDLRFDTSLSDTTQRGWACHAEAQLVVREVEGVQVVYCF